MVLRLWELGETFTIVYTPTGNELPGVAEHMAHVCRIVGQPIVRIPAPSLGQLIDEQQCLPSWRMRVIFRNAIAIAKGEK